MHSLKESRIQGRAVSRGIAIGKIVCLHGNKRQFVQRSIPESALTIEVERFKSLLETAKATLRSDIVRSKDGQKFSISEILESHLMILDDPLLEARITKRIKQKKVNSESAIQSVFDETASNFLASTDGQLREKALDIEDLCDRLLNAVGNESNKLSIEPNSIVAAKEIKPSTLLELIDDGIAGVVAESGGWTSHTSILARESKIPAITGITKIGKQFHDGQTVIIDGFSGQAICDPHSSTVTAYQNRDSTETVSALPSGNTPEVVKTLDGRIISIRTNTTSAESYRSAESNGARGIGLLRSESFISKFRRIPSEEEQTKSYIELGDVVGDHGVRIRTFDIDADQYLNAQMSRQKNPALGLRAIRLGILNKELLVPQLKAILRASYSRRIDVIVPMVTGVFELESVRQIMADEAEKLVDSNIPIGSPLVGAMIEIPSAVFVADQIAMTSDFLCLGTNDLAQYLLAADRDNESVSQWFQTLHPAMLRAVKHVIDVCRMAGKPLIVCGEMAGSPFYAPVLIGLGATELSMNPSSIGPVTRVIGGIAFEEAAELVQDLDMMTTAEAIESKVSATANKKWPHLYSNGFLESRSS
ncbi:MAG: phosphoenolpyruvate--protein phosphotransferase [Pyrinomonadaceae bacterium]